MLLGHDNHQQPHLGVSHGRQRVVDAGSGGGHGQQGRDGQHHPGRGRLVVQPEGHPGHTDSHEGRDVDGEDVIRQLSLELHVHREAAVYSRGSLHVALTIVQVMAGDTSGM